MRLMDFQRAHTEPTNMELLDEKTNHSMVKGRQFGINMPTSLFTANAFDQNSTQETDFKARCSLAPARRLKFNPLATPFVPISSDIRRDLTPQYEFSAFNGMDGPYHLPSFPLSYALYDPYAPPRPDYNLDPFDAHLNDHLNGPFYNIPGFNLNYKFLNPFQQTSILSVEQNHLNLLSYSLETDLSPRQVEMPDYSKSEQPKQSIFPNQGNQIS